ncbi:MAG: pyridoxamine 5'-phosphate oxidase family protein [Actinomycetota bacterium]|nr:pyridoxamine 5'-phosphate oxidase family protein [Actinomycetota bacterium]
MVSWAAFAAEAPELAATVRDRFESHTHHIIGTIRADGAPRLSGTEVRMGDAELTIGMMPGSRKLSDVRRDPRVEVHSAPLDVELGAGDAKIAGRLVEIPPDPDEEIAGSFFRLDIELVSLVRVEADELVVTTWRPDRGLRETWRR